MHTLILLLEKAGVNRENRVTIFNLLQSLEIQDNQKVFPL